MQLHQLLEGIKLKQTVGDLHLDIAGLSLDSRHIRPGYLFAALRRSSSNGHDFIDAAVQQGVAAVLVEQWPATRHPDVTYIQVEDSAAVLGTFASRFYGEPSKKLKLVGVTGTNGKTSVATLLHDLATGLGYHAALFSTVEYRIGNQVYPSTHTTPDVIRLNKMMAEAVDRGCQYAFMEVSSHGIDQGRIAGLDFDIAAFTNLTHDHLDYHHTFAEYLGTKKKFFDQLSNTATAITNADDKNGLVMLQNCRAAKKTYALKTIADYHGRVIEADFDGMLLVFNQKEFWTALTGTFNAYNLLLVYAVACELGFTADEVLAQLSVLKRVNGRFETIKSPTGIYFVVDYAHTPDALENVIDSINAIRTKNERLITVFGCGGDRDAEKRPLMGKIATQKSTVAIFTSDNPRTEDPMQIIHDIERGVEPQYYSRFTSVVDRQEAIKLAIRFAEPKDIVLVAGKGHETYQDIMGEKKHFDDREVIADLLAVMGK